MPSLRKVSALIVMTSSSLLLSPDAAPAQAPASLCDPISVIGMGVVRTKGQNPRLMVTGNFHNRLNQSLAGVSVAERAKLRDLAYVSTTIVRLDDGGTRSKQVLNVLLSNGNGCFYAPSAPSTGLPDILVGDKPTLIAVGNFRNDVDDDIAIIDTHFDDFNRSAKLRIFVGDGAGHFQPRPGVSVFPLPEGQKPVAMALGRFRGPGMPVDIAVATAPTRTDATERGQLTFLRNNGNAEFRIASAPIPLGNFEPAAMLSSDHLRAAVLSSDGLSRERRYDLVIKEAVPQSSSQRRILYFKNSGEGTFPEIAVLTGAGEVAKLLLGPLGTANNDAGELDLITYDRDMTLSIFKNHGEGGFNPATRATGFVSNFAFAGGAQFGVTASDDGRLQLITAARQRSSDRLGTLLLKEDGLGHLAVDFRPFRNLSTGPESNATVSPSTLHTIPASVQLDTPQKELDIFAGLADRFLSAEHGNGKPDLALSAQHRVTETRRGPCSHQFARPLSRLILSPAGRDAVCINDIHCGLQDDEPPVCESPPQFGRCWCKCPEEPPPPPPRGCEIVKTFPPMFILLANPFDRN